MFKPGNTVVFNSSNLTIWDKYTEKEKRHYYGCFYKIRDIHSDIILETYCTPIDQCKLKIFTFICEHHPQTGHCVLMDMDNGKLLPMCHVSDFRLATEEEC
jgi:hypothetical protein